MGIFSVNRFCPFCGIEGREIGVIRYSETVEANSQVEDVEGHILQCDLCGVAYPSLAYDVKAFVALYEKTLTDLKYFDESLLQRFRMTQLVRLMRGRSIGAVSAALQIPLMDKIPNRVLDVGCGFGEFTRAFKMLGADVVATEVLSVLADRARTAGLDCRLGELQDIDLGNLKFDLILFRAVLYRTHDPVRTIEYSLAHLAPGGCLSIIDPCTDVAGVLYFARKQFPQGRYYIVDFEKFSEMLRRRFGLAVKAYRQIYGRPTAPLKKVRFWRNITGAAELVLNNQFRRKPYVSAYLLTRS